MPVHATSRSRLVLGLLASWAIATVVLGASLLAPHLLPFRDAPSQAARNAALASLRRTGAPTSWTAVHVLYAGCRCSGRIVEHLLTSTRPAGFEEVVLWVGEPTAALGALEARGARIVSTDSASLARTYHVEAVPLLVVIDPGGEVRYAGGYTERKQGADFRDTSILVATRAESAPSPLPLFGCAVSERLRASLAVWPW